VALSAERYEVTLHVLVAEPFIGFVVNLKPPKRPVVQARLALVPVDLQSLGALARPRVAADMSRVKV